MSPLRGFNPFLFFVSFVALCEKNKKFLSHFQHDIRLSLQKGKKHIFLLIKEVAMKKTFIVFVLCILISCPAADAGGLSKAGDAAGHLYTAYSGYSDAANGEDNSIEGAVQDGAAAGAVVVYGVGSAAVSGAGGLAGYAGVASAVSSLGLGSVTTAAASAMGSSATGAAATAVVTSAVGGPVVMGAIIIGGAAGISYGVYKGGQAIWNYEW